MDSAYLAKYVTIYEGEIDTGIEPEEHKCSCLICLFGRSNCNMCWVCWVFIVTLLLAVVAVILKLTGVLNAKR